MGAFDLICTHAGVLLVSPYIFRLAFEASRTFRMGVSVKMNAICPIILGCNNGSKNGDKTTWNLVTI